MFNKVCDFFATRILKRPGKAVQEYNDKKAFYDAMQKAADNLGGIAEKVETYKRENAEAERRREQEQLEKERQQQMQKEQERLTREKEEADRKAQEELKKQEEQRLQKLKAEEEKKKNKKINYGGLPGTKPKKRK